MSGADDQILYSDIKPRKISPMSGFYLKIASCYTSDLKLNIKSDTQDKNKGEMCQYIRTNFTRRSMSMADRNQRLKIKDASAWKLELVR